MPKIFEEILVKIEKCLIKYKYQGYVTVIIIRNK